MNINAGDLVVESVEGVGLVMTDPYVYESFGGYAYDVVLVKFLHGDTLITDCDELKVISASR
tara:strand:+ start:724 stop:909 length:186 start_codon:yes stop_codon:yes gene_type:complete